MRWDKLGDAAWLLLGMREAADGRKCRTYMPDTLFMDAVSSLPGIVTGAPNAAIYRLSRPRAARFDVQPLTLRRAHTPFAG